jgi:adiponectin receptor
LISLATFSYVLFEVLFVWDLHSVYHQAVYVIFCLSAIYTYGASMCYHWFHCVSHQHHETLLRMDISGIGALICGSFYPPLYYSFHCHPAFGMFYLVLVTALCIAAGVMLFFPKYSTEEYRWFRATILTSVTGVAIFPIIHLFFIYGFENALFIEKMSGVLEMIIYLVLGLVFYLSKVPERFAPGRFDILFHSHQFWHSFIFVATIVHLFNMLRVMDHFDTSPCYGMAGQFLDKPHFT